jgi:hypothetical protein
MLHKIVHGDRVVTTPRANDIEHLIADGYVVASEDAYTLSDHAADDPDESMAAIEQFVASQTWIPDELRDRIPDLHSGDGTRIADRTAWVKLFSPWSGWTWFVVEFSRSDEDTCFGWVDGLNSEAGKFRLSDLRRFEGPAGLAVERDLLFEPQPLRDARSR